MAYNLTPFKRDELFLAMLTEP